MTCMRLGRTPKGGRFSKNARLASGILHHRIDAVPRDRAVVETLLFRLSRRRRTAFVLVDA